MTEPTGQQRHKDETARHAEPKRHPQHHGQHVEYFARRFGGGVPPTAEAYARAERQWQNLPGAIRTTPTVKPAGQAPAAPKHPNDKGHVP
jgi:hypothetical protein